MHCRDSSLMELLFANTSENSEKDAAPKLAAIEKHVESCGRCQQRLVELADSAQTTEQAVEHMKAAAGHDFEIENRSSGISLEFSAALSDDVTVEPEAVELDFLLPPTHPELLGRLGRYDVERVIGKGGMGVVLKAHDGELNRVVAIKVLAPHLANSAAARRRFAREAQAAAAVLHPNVLPIYNVESDGKLPYIVMRFISGQSLQSRVERCGPLEIHVALRIAKQTAAALAAAHGQGLVHRDVKPANILLEEDVERAQLSDFGLARTADDASLTRTGIVAGTPHYMSPEQANGEPIDARSDLFSLGCVLYFMLTGHPPFRAESAMGVLSRICHHQHRPVHAINCTVPHEFSRLVDRLLAKRPSKRFESASVVEAELDKLILILQSGKWRVGSSARRILGSRRAWLATMSCVVALSALAFLPYWLSTSTIWKRTSAPPASSHPATSQVHATLLKQLRARAANSRSKPPQPVSSASNSTVPVQANVSAPHPSISREPTVEPQRLLELDDPWKRDLRDTQARIFNLQEESTFDAQFLQLINHRLSEQMSILEGQIQMLNHVDNVTHIQ